MSIIKTTKTTKALLNEKYSFDSARNVWKCGKKPIDDEEVLIHLIQYAKSQNIANAGEWAEKEFIRAKSAPEITTSAFVKERMVRNRNRRIAGKYLFAEWCSSVGIEIIGKLEDFMKRNSLLVSRFYNQIAAGYECCKKQARVAGRVMRSVFIGWELRDEDAEERSAEARRSSAQSQHHTRAEPNREGLRRYQEFMNKLFTSDP